MVSSSEGAKLERSTKVTTPGLFDGASPMDKTINSDTSVKSRAQDGREHENSDVLVTSKAQVGRKKTINNNALVTSLARRVNEW